MARWLLRQLVRRVLLFADNALQIHSDDLLKQQPAVTFNVIEIKDAGRLTPQQFLEHRFSFDERQCPQVFTIQVQQVEGNEHARAAHRV